MRRRDIYGRSAEYFDAIYESRVDYDGDAEFVLDAFRQFGKGRPKRLMDVGAGTGGHALLLAKTGVKVDAVDISQPLLDEAQRKAKEARLDDKVKLHHMDMTRGLPAGKYDGAISMSGAWCYARSDEDTAKLLSMLWTRLPKGGLFVFEFRSPLGWRPRDSWLDVDLPDGRRVVRLARPKRELADDVFEVELEHLVLRDGKLIEDFSEVHGMRLRTPHQTRTHLQRNGFEVAAFTSGEAKPKTFDAPGPNDFRVMCVAKRV